MKRILLVTDAWRPQVNGVVFVFENIKKVLEARGHGVAIAHPGLFRITVPLPLYPEIKLAVFPERRLRRMFDDVRPDAVHIATEGPLGLAARRICRRRNIPYTTSYHTHFPLYSLHYSAMWFTPIFSLVYAYIRWFHRGANATMVATDSLRRELEDHGFKDLRIWPLGVDSERFTRNPAPPLPALAKPVFVFFSRLAVEKSPEKFLELDLPGTKLVIGDGPLRAALEKKYAGTAHFAGYRHGQDLVDWLSLSDVFVFPSRTETFGLVVLEALSCGIPVAAPNVMGPRDIITNGIDGYIDEDLERAAIACLALDRAACRNKALQYSWERSAETFLENLVPIPHNA